MTGIWLGQTVGPLAVRLGFNPTACTGFLKPIFFGGMDILLTLDTGVRALILHQSDVSDFAEFP